jgi:hypothetical protein
MNRWGVSVVVSEDERIDRAGSGVNDLTWKETDQQQGSRMREKYPWKTTKRGWDEVYVECGRRKSRGVDDNPAQLFR